MFNSKLKKDRFWGVKVEKRTPESFLPFGTLPTFWSGKKRSNSVNKAFGTVLKWKKRSWVEITVQEFFFSWILQNWSILAVVWKFPRHDQEDPGIYIYIICRYELYTSMYMAYGSYMCVYIYKRLYTQVCIIIYNNDVIMIIMMIILYM